MPHAFVLVETARPPTWTNPVHNTTYQPRTRDTDSNSSVDCTLTHDAAGNLTDDGKDYSYVSDAFGRLKTVKNRGSSAVVAEYTYNGLNMRIDWHTSYDIPLRIDPGDYNRDGYINGNDLDDYGDDFDNTRAEADVDFDGDVDEDDYDLFSAWWDAPSTAGRFTLSASTVGNRIGYAGYKYDPTFVGASRAVYRVRNRVYDAGLGRWMRRDPAEYLNGKNYYQYAKLAPVRYIDGSGLQSKEGVSCSGSSVLPHFTDNPACHSSMSCTLDADGTSGKACYDAIKRNRCDQGHYGGVVCCNGTLIICQWIPNMPGGTVISICVLKHEETHLDDSDCDNCPQGKVCRPNWPPGKNANAEKCKGYQTEANCLDSHKGLCDERETPDEIKQCYLDVRARLKFVCSNISDLCGSNSLPTYCLPFK